MGKSSAPPAPDYEAAAIAQGVAERDTAQYNNAANRVDQVGPQGSSTWSIRPGADPNNPQPGDYTQTTTLSADQQRQYDEGNRITEALLGMSGRQLALVDKTFSTPLDLSSLPAWRTSGQGGARSSWGGENTQAQAPAQAAVPVAAGQPQAVFGGTSAPTQQIDPKAVEALLQAMMARQAPRG